MSDLMSDARPLYAEMAELKVAEEFGISRTPLREALKVLAAEGLVTMKVRRGAYVTEVSQQDLADVYRMLSLLESKAADVVATKATVTNVCKAMRVKRDDSLLKAGSMAHSLAQPREFMTAFASGNACTTARRMQDHFANGLQLMCGASRPCLKTTPNYPH